MSITQTSSQKFQDLAQSLRLVIQATGINLKQFPSYGVYIQARDQLQFIENFVTTKTLPNQDQKDIVNIALMAVKELEVSEPDYCDMLCKVDNLFKAL